MKQLEKEINISRQNSMRKRCQMYSEAASKVTEKLQKDTKKGEKR